MPTSESSEQVSECPELFGYRCRDDAQMGSIGCFSLGWHANGSAPAAATRTETARASRGKAVTFPQPQEDTAAATWRRPPAAGPRLTRGCVAPSQGDHSTAISARVDRARNARGRARPAGRGQLRMLLLAAVAWS